MCWSTNSVAKMTRNEFKLCALLTVCSVANVLYQTRGTDYCSIVFPVVDDKLQCLKDDIASFINQQNKILQEMKIKLKMMKQLLSQLEATTAGSLCTTTTTTTTPVPPSITVEVASTQDPSPSTQDPSPSTQDPSPSTQEPSTSTLVPKVCSPLSTTFPNDAELNATAADCESKRLEDHKLPVKGMNLDGDNLTALHRAVLNGDAHCVEALLRAGADHAEKTSASPYVTALMLAAAIGQEGALCELLEAGANIHAQDDNGFTALLRATNNGHLALIHLLLAAGADIEARNYDTSTPLMFASQIGREAAARALLAAGADPNALTYESKYSALMIASERGYVGIVRALLEGGADKNFKNINGHTALDIASSKGHSDIVQLLRDYGAK